MFPAIAVSAAPAAAVILQIVALHFGALALVQPILVTDLLFAAVFAAILAHRRPDWVIFACVICCAAGVGCFLAIARPHGGHSTVSFPTFLPLFALARRTPHVMGSHPEPSLAVGLAVSESRGS